MCCIVQKKKKKRFFFFLSIHVGDVKKTPWQANITPSDYQLLATCLTYHPKKTFQDSLRLFLILGYSTYDYICLEAFYISDISVPSTTMPSLPTYYIFFPSHLLHYCCQWQSLFVPKSISFVLPVCKWSRWIEEERSWSLRTSWKVRNATLISSLMWANVTVNWMYKANTIHDAHIQVILNKKIFSQYS